MENPDRILTAIQKIASGNRGWATIEITAMTAITAKARECPLRRTICGLNRHPSRKPKKCPEAINPISIVLKPSASPEMASNGRIDPIPIWTKIVEMKSADKEISKCIGL